MTDVGQALYTSSFAGTRPPRFVFRNTIGSASQHKKQLGFPQFSKWDGTPSRFSQLHMGRRPVRRLGTRFCHLDINYRSLQLKCTHLPMPLRLTATAPKCSAVSWQLGQKNWRLPPPRPTSTKGPTTKTSGTCK